MGMMLGGGGFDIMSQIQEGFANQVVSTGLKAANFYEKVRFGDQKKSRVSKTATEHYARQLYQYISADMEDVFVEWMLVSKTLEHYAMKPQMQFPSEEQIVAEELFKQWLALEQIIRQSIENPEQRVSYEENCGPMMKYFESLFYCILEACETMHITDKAIDWVLDRVEKHEQK